MGRKTNIDLSTDILMLIVGIIFCILEGAGAIQWGWVVVCIPFMIMGGLLVERLIEIGICAIITIIANR